MGRDSPDALLLLNGSVLYYLRTINDLSLGVLISGDFTTYLYLNSYTFLPCLFKNECVYGGFSLILQVYMILS